MYDYRRSRPRWFSPTRLDGGHAVWSSEDEERGRDAQTKEKREKKGECVDYYFNTGLIWRTHKGRCGGARSKSPSDQLWSVDSSACPKYIFQIYISLPFLSLSLSNHPPCAHTYTHVHIHAHPLAQPSKRSIVRTFAPSVIAESHPRPPSALLASLPGLHRRSRGCTYVSCIRLSSAIYSRATRARRWRGKRRPIIYEGGSASPLPIKGIMNRGATSFFSSLSLPLRIPASPPLRSARGNVPRARNYQQ